MKNKIIAAAFLGATAVGAYALGTAAKAEDATYEKTADGTVVKVTKSPISQNDLEEQYKNLVNNRSEVEQSCIADLKSKDEQIITLQKDIQSVKELTKDDVIPADPKDTSDTLPVTP